MAAELFPFSPQSCLAGSEVICTIDYTPTRIINRLNAIVPATDPRVPFTIFNTTTMTTSA